jgi:hypothetical protein
MTSRRLLVSLPPPGPPGWVFILIGLAWLFMFVALATRGCAR